jgi:hypothetical protein
MCAVVRKGGGAAQRRWLSAAKKPVAAEAEFDGAAAAERARAASKKEMPKDYKFEESLKAGAESYGKTQGQGLLSYTWALCALGLGGFGFAGYRSRANRTAAP